MRYLRIGVFLACVFLSAYLVDGQGNSRNGRFPAELQPCDIQDVKEPLLCGKMSVFEDREARMGRKIDLNMIILLSIGGPKFDPLFDLDGGPGAPDTKNAAYYANEAKKYREGRDIVLVDQRGTGASNPLNCKPLSSAPASILSEMYPVEYVRTCRRELEKTASLGLYTTEIAVDDLDDVRAWLGYKKIDLSAISYGTRVAQAFARRHPESTGRIVLMGALGTYHRLPFYHAPNAQRSMDLLLDECLADKECRAAFPDIKAELKTLIERLARKPETVHYVDPKTGSSDEIMIRAAEFAERLRSDLYSRVQSQEVPFVVHNAANGNFRPFLDRALAGAGSLSFIADGMYLSVTCAEDVPFIKEAEATKLSKDTIFGNYRVFQQVRACKNWVRGKISPEFRKPVVSDVPLLIISGNLDPVTPPAWGAEIVTGFRNGRQIVVPESAHLPDGLSNVDCIDKIVLDFLDGTSAKNVNDSCVRTMFPGPFLTIGPTIRR